MNYIIDMEESGGARRKNIWKGWRNGDGRARDSPTHSSDGQDSWSSGRQIVEWVRQGMEQRYRLLEK